MKKTQTLFLAGILCILALVSMVLALISGERIRSHLPSPRRPSTPPPKAESLRFRRSLGGRKSIRTAWRSNVPYAETSSHPGGAADVYFTNSSEQEVWLKLRVLDEDGSIIGETGLIKPGEYVKSVLIDKDVSDGSSIKLKIMAYEPQTYYSAGAVTLNTQIRKEAA